MKNRHFRCKRCDRPWGGYGITVTRCPFCLGPSKELNA